jgi:hypothetical protein
MQDRTRTRITLTIFLIVLFLGLWMIVKSATGQSSTPVCQPNDTTQTCLALLDQKSGQIDIHVSNTDKNVDSIVADLKNIDKDIAEIKRDEAWERGIWGSIVTLLAGGFFLGHFKRKSATNTSS